MSVIEQKWLGIHELWARGLKWLLSSQLLRRLLWFCLFETAFYFAYRYGMSFSKASASPFWFPDAVLLCALLLTRPTVWWLFILAPLPIRLFAQVSHGIPLWFLLTTFAIDSARALFAATVLRHWLKNPRRFETVREFVIFCLVAVSLAPALSAFGGAAARQALGDSYWVAWERWFFGDALAQLVLTPTILYWVFGEAWKIPTPSANRGAEGGMLALCLILTGWIAFDTMSTEAGFAEARFFAPVPFLFWAAIRFGMLGATGAIMVLAIISVEAALVGRGPFSGQSPAATAQALQQFLLLRAAPLFFVAISVEQRKQSENSLHENQERTRLSLVRDLSEREKAEQKFRGLLESAPDAMVIVDQEGKIILVNSQTENLFGYQRDELLGQAVEILVPERLRVRHTHHRAGFANNLKARPMGAALELFAQRRDGSEFPVEISLSPLETEEGILVSSSIRDITERKRAQQALRASEERYRAVVESQTDLVCRYLQDTTLSFVNDAYCRCFNRTRQELIGTKFLELIPAAGRDKVLNTIGILSRERRMVTLEHEVILADGTIGWQQWTNYPIFGSDGKAAEFQAIGHDITDRKRSEEANRNLAHASRLAIVGELTAMIAHEINQPLGAIQNNADAAEMLLESSNPRLEEVRQILTEIRKDNERATEAIYRIRALLRKRDIDMRPLVLNDVILEALQFVTGDALLRRVEIQSELASKLPVIRADRVQLQQVLLNLLLNAMEAVAELPLKERRVQVRTEFDGGGFAVVTVADSGPGIPADKLPLVFESFFTTKIGGMGLGLSIAKSIIDNHKGQIWAENSSCGGAVFRFRIPFIQG